MIHNFAEDIGIYSARVADECSASPADCEADEPLVVVVVEFIDGRPVGASIDSYISLASSGEIAVVVVVVYEVCGVLRCGQAKG